MLNISQTVDFVQYYLSILLFFCESTLQRTFLLPYSPIEQVFHSAELQKFLCGIDLMNVSVYCDSQ